MNQIPGFLPPNDLCDKGSTEFQDIAALAVAKLFDPNLKRCDVHLHVQGCANKLDGVMCNGGIVLSGCQIHAATHLPRWLSSTILLPDIAVYPYKGEKIEGVNAVKVMKDVQRTNIPFFIAEYYSVTILKTTRELAIKLIALLQLHRLYGCNQSEVSGLVLPAMETKSLDEVSIGMAQVCLNPDENMNKGSSVTSTDELVKEALLIQQDQASKANSLKPKCKIAPKNQNTAILVMVKWDCSTLTFIFPMVKKIYSEENSLIFCEINIPCCIVLRVCTKSLDRRPNNAFFH